MNKATLLSGVEIVNKGTTKINTSLPEHGLKDVTSNGSWLEQKQVQTALEARKHLIEVERIEKCGVLSHAEWQEDLMLAKVTQHTGGHWQYLGHHVDKCLYLRPEEALFLIEVNCLLLKHNGVTVSLQQAYSLLLREKITILQYKVYAYLSRLGYKVFRHSILSKSNGFELNKDNIEDNTKNEISEHIESNSKEIEHVASDQSIQCNEISDTTIVSNKAATTSIPDSKIDCVMDTDNISTDGNEISKSNDILKSNKTIQQCSLTNYQCNLQKLSKRKVHGPHHRKDTHKYYENFPDFFSNVSVTVQLPKQEHLPNNIVFNKSVYNLKMHNINTKDVNDDHPPSANLEAYSLTDEDTGARRTENVSTNNAQNPSQGFPTYPPFPRNTQFNQHPWRHRFHFNYCQFNLILQRPLFHPSFSQPRFLLYPRFSHFMKPPPYVPHCNTNQIHNTRKRLRDRSGCRGKHYHLDNIKRLALRMKLHKLTTNMNVPSNFNWLQRLVLMYNERYNETIRITEDLDVVDDILETIELEDEEDTRNKRLKLDICIGYDENISKVKEVANKLKELEAKGMSSARHRRALSHVIKTFNKSYNADIYMNEQFTIIDKKHITLDSSSDSDCVVNESPPRRSKMLRNPFNVLKRLSETHEANAIAGTSKQIVNESNIDETIEKENKYNDFITKSFDKNWLPNENDFGRAEIPPKSMMNTRIVNANKDEFLYDFIKYQSYFDNWLDIKISFYRSMEAAAGIFQKNIAKSNSVKMDSIIKSEDYLNMPSILKKLCIIPNNKEVNHESTLTIDFDVYNRDVQNFKKTNPPVPHFRVICVNESSTLPSGVDINALSSKYQDEVPIVFAVVGVSSISYIQVMPNDLPTYNTSSDFI
ncbi:uncharacterized protein LOC131843844 [Achroia grisella]|uniref:uncharacterized protein LOC131843844 n=1 Tax=Achroia grisella TaxID=688607 RepID=UPI0027D2A01B|nr:uncharacterized protein LOC131843844 [Achroia grisella]